MPIKVVFTEMVLTGYNIVEKIAETPRTVIVKAYCKDDPEQPFSVKILKGQSLTELQKTQIKQKIKRLAVIREPFVITPSSFGEQNNSFYIVQRYYDGITLERLLESRSKLRLEDFLIVARNLAEALHGVHRAGIIHGGVKPHNILVEPNTLDIRLIDLINVHEAAYVNHFYNDTSYIRDTLAYMAPEQTGRIGHRSFFSSDLYSLGIVFYEMLTGCLPFFSYDPYEIVHFHLAKEAPQVREFEPAIPAIVNEIVAMLMKKEPEERYQSSSGLSFDLSHCLDELLSTGTVKRFSLDSRAHAKRVTFISKLVGRCEEAKAIVNEYDRVAQGEFRSVLISGLPGIGKTRLVQEVRKHIVEHKGYFTAAKSDLYQRNIPYNSIIQALQNLVQIFLTEDDKQVNLWKSRILEAVGENGRLLTDVIPELDLLIGSQPEVIPLPSTESLNRFHAVFDRFINCLAAREHPVTIFIDDLQWSDSATIDFLIRLLANASNHPYLFLLGAYRHNEVELSHPLAKLVQNVNNVNNDRLPLRELRLEALKPEHTHAMVSDILDSELSKSKALSDFINTLSEGNPLFVSESLSYLYNENLLISGNDMQWSWDISKVRQSKMPNTVVLLFNSKIKKLPPASIATLEYCACMGNTFSPEEIALITGKELNETYEALYPALQQGLLVQTKNDLQFVHDRIQEAAIASLSEERRRQIHWEIGNRLLAAVPSDLENLEELDNLFVITSHLNLGLEDINDRETAYRLSAHNYHAGSKALNSLAIETANEYLRMSRELLQHDCWQEEHYEQTFRIYQKSAKAALMCGDPLGSERLLNELLDHASSDLDRAECLAEQTTTLSSMGNFIEAIETANQGLAFFRKSIPKDIALVEKKTKELIRDIAARGDIWEIIGNMPLTQDRRSKIEFALYGELVPDLYLAGRITQLYLMAAQATELCLSEGMDESVLYAFCAMGLLHAEQEEYEQSFKYEDLVRDLCAKHPYTFGATKGMNGSVFIFMHSRSSSGDIVDYCLKAIQCGKKCGDLFNSGLSYGPLMWNLQISGTDLLLIEDYVKECCEFSNRYHLALSVGLAEAMQMGWVEPMKNGYVNVPVEEKLKQWNENNHVVLAGSYYIHKAIVHYYFGEYNDAESCLNHAEHYLSGLSESVLKREWRIFRVLTTLRLYGNIPELETHVRKIDKWGSLGPLFNPYLILLQAESARVEGDAREARSLYLDAINAANKQGYTFLEGYINECLGRFMLACGQASARLYLAEAYCLYKRCHAERKVTSLAGEYPEYLPENELPVLRAEVEPSLPYRVSDLDVEYLMKSFLAMAAEIDQDALLKKIMDVAVESTGAQHAYLLLEEEGSLYIKAESHVSESKAINRLLDKKLDDVEDICRAIIRYVYRTGELQILNDASREGAFRANPEVQSLHLRSVFCLPVVKQSKKKGVLYLENRLSDAVFTTEKTQITELLMSQAAIALDNARLVESMKNAEEALRRSKEELESRVQERTFELARANELLEKDIVERKHIEELVKAERQRFNDIIEVLPAYLILLTPDYHVPVANRFFRERFGDSGGRRCYEYLFNRDEPCENCMTFEVLKTMSPIEWEWVGPDGHYYYVYDFPFKDVDGSTCILEMGIDVTDRKKAEEEINKLTRELEQRVSRRTAQLAAANKELYASESNLRAALYEKEVLLKEIHHRVKNNLQIIYSMLNLQLPYVKDRQAIELFEESKNRVYSMALIHEKLYQSESLVRIDLPDYIRNLITNLFLSYGVSERTIIPRLYIEDISLDIDIVIPCALIINELVSNSLKYAFPSGWSRPGAQGEICIELNCNSAGGYILIVQDNGIGIPNDLDISRCESLGLKLVRVLVNQLKGDMELYTKAGTQFVITFSAVKGKKEIVCNG